jgi:hypothetical protein
MQECQLCSQRNQNPPFFQNQEGYLIKEKVNCLYNGNY